MAVKLNAALEAVEMTYKDLNTVANEITNDFFEPINKIISDLNDINSLDNDSIRNYMIRLSLAGYSLGEVKEKSAFKAELSEAIRKETFARNYAQAEGTSSSKDNTATLQSSSEIVTEALYNLVANLFKTKLDEVHRIISVLQSVLVSRNMEAKLTINTID